MKNFVTNIELTKFLWNQLDVDERIVMLNWQKIKFWSVAVKSEPDFQLLDGW